RDGTQQSAVKRHWIMTKRIEMSRNYLSGKVLPHHFLVDWKIRPASSTVTIFYGCPLPLPLNQAC
ncbi:MAG: hypothetical protein P8179_24265, partial [Candidatus Thiodiazotropha sp.]